MSYLICPCGHNTSDITFPCEGKRWMISDAALDAVTRYGGHPPSHDYGEAGDCVDRDSFDRCAVEVFECYSCHRLLILENGINVSAWYLKDGPRALGDGGSNTELDNAKEDLHQRDEQLSAARSVSDELNNTVMQLKLALAEKGAQLALAHGKLAVAQAELEEATEQRDSARDALSALGLRPLLRDAVARVIAFARDALLGNAEREVSRWMERAIKAEALADSRWRCGDE